MIGPDDIGKLVRVGDVPEGATVNRGDSSRDVWRVTAKRDLYVDMTAANGDFGTCANESRATLLSLPADRDVKPENAPDPHEGYEPPDERGRRFPSGPYGAHACKCPACCAVHATFDPPPIDPHRVYGPGAPVSPPEKIGTAALQKAAFAAFVAEHAPTCAPDCDPVAPGELAPRLTVPSTHPCPERASCIAETAALRVRVDAAEATNTSLRERVLELDAQRDNAAAISREAVEAMDAAGMQRDAARRALAAERDCGQAGVCGVSPGCDRHWGERVATLNQRLAEVRAELSRAYAQRDAAEIAQATAERERNEARNAAALPALARLTTIGRCADVAKAEAETWECDEGTVARQSTHIARRIEAAIRKLGGA